MRKNKKIWILTAISLLIAGGLIALGALIAMDFNFMELSTQEYETNTYEISDHFDKISVNASTPEIEFVQSEDETCRIECIEWKKEKYSAAVRNGTLEIDTVNARKWYDYIGFHFGNEKLTVYLPKTAYVSLFVDSDTGDVEIPAGFSFERIEITGNTSDIACDASASELMEISTDTGDIKVEFFRAGEVKLTADTGSIKVSAADAKGGAACESLFVESDTGNIIIENVIAEAALSVESDTGYVKFEGCDAGSIMMKTDTGDITGTLLSEKVIIAESSIGDVDVPKTTTGGRCELTTGTGDIRITITNESRP